jgi:hypothetical protein
MESEPEINLDEFEALKPQRKPCVFQRAATILDKGELRTLHAALDAGYSNRIIAQWLTQRGVDVAESTVQKHRRGGCNCAR